MKFSTSDTVVVLKLSQLQLDMNTYGLDESDLKDKYMRDGKDADRIFRGHERHMESVQLIKKYFSNGNVIYREGFNRSVADAAGFVISGGGDESTKYVSHYVTRTPLLGVNTTPMPGGSRGALLEKDIEITMEKLEKGQYDVSKETRIEALVNGVPMPFLGMSIFSMRGPGLFGNCRYALGFGDEQCVCDITSGMVVYCGNGLTDWTKGASRYIGGPNEIWPTERKIGWVVSEPHDDYKLLSGALLEGEELTAVCYKDDIAIAPDAIKEHTQLLQSGDRIAFRVASTPLMHVRMR